MFNYRGGGSSRPRYDWLARHPGEDAACHQQVSGVEEALQDGRGLGIAQERMQDITKSAAFGKNVSGIPEGRRAHGQPTELLHVLDGITEQPGGKDQEQDAHDTEEDAIVKSIAQAIDEDA